MHDYRTIEDWVICKWKGAGVGVWGVRCHLLLWCSCAFLFCKGYVCFLFSISFLPQPVSKGLVSQHVTSHQSCLYCLEAYTCIYKHRHACTFACVHTPSNTKPPEKTPHCCFTRARTIVRTPVDKGKWLKETQSVCMQESFNARPCVYGQRCCEVEFKVKLDAGHCVLTHLLWAGV